MLKSNLDDSCIYGILFSVVSPCKEEDLMRRPNAERFIDSTNPQESGKLVPDKSGSWISEPNAAMSIAPNETVQVMRVEMQGVKGVDTIFIFFERNGIVVRQLEVEPNKDGVSI